MPPALTFINPPFLFVWSVHEGMSCVNWPAFPLHQNVGIWFRSDVTTALPLKSDLFLVNVTVFGWCPSVCPERCAEISFLTISSTRIIVFMRYVTFGLQCCFTDSAKRSLLVQPGKYCRSVSTHYLTWCYVNEELTSLWKSAERRPRIDLHFIWLAFVFMWMLVVVILWWRFANGWRLGLVDRPEGGVGGERDGIGRCVFGKALLGAFAKLREVTISVVMCPSARLPAHPHAAFRLPRDGF